MNKIYQKMYLTKKSRSKGVLSGFIDNVILRSFYSESHPLSVKRAGFTLIELLVVVLIIGILAAVALPQYQVAVEKSRFARVQGNVRALKDAAELYYLTNGSYPPDSTEGLESLDFGRISGCRLAESGQMLCEQEWYDYIFYEAGQVVGFTRPQEADKMNGYLQWLDHSSHPGRMECLAAEESKVAQQVCRSIGGTAGGSIGKEGWRTYILP